MQHYKQTLRPQVLSNKVGQEDCQECDRMILVLDESGSMATQTDDIIGGINTMIRKQRKLEPERNNKIFFDIVKFSDYVRPVISNTLRQIKEFTNADYQPSGGTALYDAIGSTIMKYRNENNVIMIIATDGGENASKTHNYHEIVRLIGEQREHHNWNMVYLSENIDTFQQGNRIGLVNGDRGSYNTCVQQLGKAMQTDCYNQNISNIRKCKTASFSGLSKF
jgi:von Willebrand factor type A domain